VIPELAFVTDIVGHADPTAPLSGHPTLAETCRRFEAAAFPLTITPIETGRYLACATEVTSGRGPVAMAATPEAAARVAWMRFTEHRSYYTLSCE
jgi:hypothetical protein